MPGGVKSVERRLCVQHGCFGDGSSWMGASFVAVSCKRTCASKRDPKPQSDSQLRAQFTATASSQSNKTCLMSM